MSQRVEVPIFYPPPSRTTMDDREVAARTRARCRTAISGPPVRVRVKCPKYKGPLHQIRPDNASNTDEQLQSPFLSRLPFDIRFIVYEDLLRPMTPDTWARLSRNYLGYSGCGRVRSQSCAYHHSRHAWSAFDDHCPTLALQTDCSFMSFLLTCRHMYFEALYILYRRASIALFDLQGLNSFISRTPTHYLSAMTSLNLTWSVFPPLYISTPAERAFYGKNYNPAPTEELWSKLCFQLAQMPRLNKIKITLHNFNLTGLKLLGPLLEAFSDDADDDSSPSARYCIDAKKEESSSSSNSSNSHSGARNCPGKSRMAGESRCKRKVSDFEVTLDYEGDFPLDTSGTKDVPFRIRLLPQHLERKSAPGARVWPPPAFREPNSWEIAGGRVVAGLGRCVGAAKGAWLALRSRIR